MSYSTTKTAGNLLRCVILISALLLLTSCACDPEVRVVTKTETVPVPVEVIKPLPASLTDPIPYPPELPPDYDIGDMRELAFALYDLLDDANEDREDARQLTQPSAEDTPQ